MIIDTHSHCKFSADSTAEPTAMIETAIKLGLEYYAITDHCDKDYLTAEVKDVRQLDIEGQYACLSKLKEEYSDKIDFGVGIEIGYSALAANVNASIVSAKQYDYIINSVHVVDSQDAYFGGFFDNKTKMESYTRYLSTVRESLDVAYRYDAVGHIGYCSRYANYADPYMYYRETPEIIDDILLTIIKKDKILEVNTNVKNSRNKMLPTLEILERYRLLGGKLITFASDAHTEARICDKYDLVAEMLVDIGYKELAYVHNNKLNFIKI